MTSSQSSLAVISQIRKGTEGDLTQDKHLFYEKNFYSKFGQDYNATGDQFSNCFTFELFLSLHVYDIQRMYISL